ncbi:C40 family peptidase [Microterricola pindariensis]|nr:C40 family peptidase [Microterricola pindariensis]
MTTAMTEAIGRMQSIRSTIEQLNGATATRAAASPDTTVSGANSDFTALLNQALSGAGATQGTGVPGSEGVTGNAVKDAAMKYIGVPYVFGGEDASGMDCSGLVQRVYADLGIEVPRLVSGQMTAGTPVASLAEAQPGDLIVTDNAEHIVIYAGDNKVIHAPYEGRTVSHVERWFDESDIVTIRRIVPTNTANTANTAGLDIQALLGSLGGQQSATTSVNESLLAAARAAMLSGGTR